MNDKRDGIIHNTAAQINYKQSSVPEIKVMLMEMLDKIDALDTSVVLYDAMVNADSTEGRGPMRSVGLFTDEMDAFRAIKGKGPMGCSNGDIWRVTIVRTADEAKKLGGTSKREQIYGYGRDWDGKWREHWFDGRDKPDQDPEFSDYLRLKRKFEK